VGETSRSTRGWCGPANMEVGGLDALWNDDAHHAAMCGSRAAMKRITPITSARRRSLSRWPNGASYIKASVIRGNAAGAGRPPSVCRGHVRQFRAKPRPGRQFGPRSESTRVDQSRTFARHDGLFAAGAGTPLLFQGQEFASSSPFLYFADSDARRARLLAQGRGKFLSQFRSYALDEMQKLLTTRPIRKPLSARSSTLPIASATHRFTLCIAICCDCGAKIQCLPPRIVRGWRAPC